MPRARITAKKHGGDDAFSWAVFIDGVPMVTGLSRREVPYYKKEAQAILDKRKTAPVCKLPDCGCTGEAHAM